MPEKIKEQIEVLESLQKQAIACGDLQLAHDITITIIQISEKY